MMDTYYTFQLGFGQRRFSKKVLTKLGLLCRHRHSEGHGQVTANKEVDFFACGAPFCLPIT